jgi:2TM domain-containing protein
MAHWRKLALSVRGGAPMGDVALERYEVAERQLVAHEGRTGLRAHTAVTVVVVVALAVVNVFVAPEFPWAVFPAVGMGIGVWFHWYFGVRHGDDVMRRHQEQVEQRAERLAA